MICPLVLVHGRDQHICCKVRDLLTEDLNYVPVAINNDEGPRNSDTYNDKNLASDQNVNLVVFDSVENMLMQILDPPWDIPGYVIMCYDIAIADLKIIKRRPCAVFLEIIPPFQTLDDINHNLDSASTPSSHYKILADNSLSKLAVQVTGFVQRIPDLIRPSWDLYFMRLAYIASSRSNCRKRRVGAIIALNRRVVATGYNGTPAGFKNCMDGGCNNCLGVKSGLGIDNNVCICMHAEANAILEIGRPRCAGATLYVTCMPCLGCAMLIIQSGIKRVFYNESYKFDSDANSLLASSNIQVSKIEEESIIGSVCSFMP